MRVEVQVAIDAPRSAVWAAMSDIERAAEMLSGVERVEILERPTGGGLVGLKWRETRTLFGKSASADKWITDAVEHESYATRAESDGFVFVSTMRVAGRDGRVTLTSVHDSVPQTLAAKVMAIPMGLFFTGVAKKALLQDLNDIKAAAER